MRGAGRGDDPSDLRSRGRSSARLRVSFVLYGPTSSGKTDLSLRLCDAASARGYRPVVLNADSRQIYRGMDIGTSKIAQHETRGYDHLLLDIADPASKLGLEHYVAVARDTLTHLSREDSALPILVGGTGIYVQAILRGWDVGGTDALRRSLERDLPRKYPQEAHDLLRRLSRQHAERIHPNNYEAVINALVRLMSEGGESEPAPFRFAVFGLDAGPRVTDARIERTLRSQLSRGLVDEVDALDQRLALREAFRRRHAGARSVVLETHGYREYIEQAALAGRRTTDLRLPEIERATAEVLKHIKAYSRRQRTWFTKLGAHVIEPGQLDDLWQMV